MDSLITAAARALAAGVPLGALEAASPCGVKADQPHGPLHIFQRHRWDGPDERPEDPVLEKGIDVHDLKPESALHHINVRDTEFLEDRVVRRNC